MPDSALNAEVDAKVFRDLIARMSTRVPAAINRAMRTAGAAHTRAMAKRFEPYQGRRSGFDTAIQTRSGALRRSFGFALNGSGADAELRMFSAGLPYTRTQEFGGVIRPKSKRYLTVPLPDALTASGVPKGGARLVQRGTTKTGRPKYATADGQPTFIFRSRRGSLLIGSRARNGRTRLLYALREQVNLRPRLGFRHVFETYTAPLLLDLMRAGLGGGGAGFRAAGSQSVLGGEPS